MAGAVTGEPTEQLLRRIRAGEDAAKQALYERCLPLLRRWAHGRLPSYARDIADTDDLVQVTLLRALNRVDEFDSQGSGCFLAYLRHILLNEVRGEMRKRQRRGSMLDVDDHAVADETASVVEQLVGQERMRSYENALATLDRQLQSLVVMRIEFGMSFQEIAVETGASPDAVRMRLARALKSIAGRVAAPEE
jgi:RNA polymerase sigma factor (sigma-70 family)